MKGLKFSDIFKEYWYFAFKRQERFKQKVDNKYQSLDNSCDTILDRYKFTNCYRATDRASQYLIKNVIYADNYSPEDTFLRVVLFKIFNKIETWEYLVSRLGDISFLTFNPREISALLHEKINLKRKIYSAAYIMPSGSHTFGFDRKHDNHIALVEMMIKQELPLRIWDLNSLSDIYHTLLSYPMIGPFLAMQYAVDLAYSEFTEANESEFIIAGPGAKRGIEKCFKDIGNYTTSDIIKYMTDHQEQFFNENNLSFGYLQNRKLQLIDCQNLFCEFDKYCRVRFPEVAVGNKRIKQKYRPQTKPIDYFFPPKWNAAI